MKTHILDSTEFFGSNSKIILWLGTYIFIIGIFPYSFPPSIWDSGSCWKKNTECQSEITISEAHMEPLPVNCHCWTLQIQLHIFKATFPLWTYSVLLQMKNPSEFKLWRLFPCRIAKIKFKMLKKKRGGWVGGNKKKNLIFFTLKILWLTAQRDDAHGVEFILRSDVCTHADDKDVAETSGSRDHPHEDPQHDVGQQVFKGWNAISVRFAATHVRSVPTVLEFLEVAVEIKTAVVTTESEFLWPLSEF